MQRESTHPVPYRPIVDHPPFAWPHGARVAIWVVPNVEHLRPELLPSAPDIRNYSRFDYGNRVGIWRVMDVLEKHGVKGTVALNGDVARHYPRIMDAIRELDWELMGHGMTNSMLLRGREREEESSIIAETRSVIESAGARMRGWLGPGLGETWNTLDLLQEQGVDYVCDWVNDDLPYRMRNGLYAIPYSLEHNDMPLFNMPSIANEEFERRIRESFDVLYAEGARLPRVMAIALHPFLVGVPHRIGYLDRALQHIRQHDKVWFATGSQIIDAYRQATAPHHIKARLPRVVP